MQQGIRTEPQGLQVFVLALFVDPSGEVPHDLETSLQVSLSHPAVDFLHFLMFFKMKNENLSLLVSYFEGTDLLFSNLFGLQFFLGFSFKYHCSFNSWKTVGLLFFLLLLYHHPLLLSVQFLFNFIANTDYLTVLDHTLGKFTQKLLLRGGPEVVVGLRLETIYLVWTLRGWTVVSFSQLVDYFHEHSVGILPLQNVGEVSIDEVPQNLKRLFALVGKEVVAFDSDSVAKEADWQRFSLSELMNPVFLVDFSPLAFWVQPPVKFLNPSDDGVDIDLWWHTVLIIAFFDGLLYFFLFKFTLNLIPNPFKPVFFEVILHLLNFLP